MKQITVIPSTIPLHMPITPQARRKVAGYARVSTDQDEQSTSYAAQLDYYTKFIKSHGDWDFVGLYADEGMIKNTMNWRGDTKKARKSWTQ